MFILDAIVLGGAALAGANMKRKLTQPKKPWIATLETAPKPAVPLHKTRRQTGLQKFGRATLTLLLRGVGDKPLVPLIDDTERDVMEAKLGSQAKLSALVFGVAIAGTWFSPALLLLSAGGLIYLTIPVWRMIWEQFKSERRFSMYDLFGLCLPAMLLTGYIMATAAGYFFFILAMHLAYKAKNRTHKEITHVFGQQPRSVWVLGGDDTQPYELEIPFEQVQVGDIVIVHAGELIPVDGTVVDGMAGVDQRMLTGESQPSEKPIGDPVFAATLVLSGQLQIRVDKTGSEALAAQIEDILTQTTHFAESVQLRTVQITDRLMLPYLGMMGVAWPLLGLNQMLVLVWTPIAEAMILTGPLSVVNYLSLASNQGLLVKDGRALELLCDVDTFVFDKTGTLTEDQPHVSAVHRCGAYTEADILTFAAAAEYRQTHPIAQAIQQAAAECKLTLPPLEEAEYEMGYGLKALVHGRRVRVDSANFMAAETIAVPEAIRAVQADCHALGRSLVYVAVDETLAGAIELHPTMRPEAASIIRDLKQRGYALYIISGDQEKPTRTLADELGIEHYFAETLPENKADLIEQLQQEGKSVCFVGDGINDAIALKKAQVSVSLRGASTVATDTAQVVMRDGSLKQLPALLELAEGLENNLITTTLFSTIPSALIVGGVFFLNMGMSGAIALYTVGMGGSVVNAVWPMRQVWLERVRHVLPKRFRSQTERDSFLRPPDLAATRK